MLTLGELQYQHTYRVKLKSQGKEQYNLSTTNSLEISCVGIKLP